MPRDPVIKNAFEVADDGIQGVFGYFMYGTACRKAADPSKLISYLPTQQFPMTHDWDRNYDPSLLHQAMTLYFDAYHARISLVSIIGTFEGCLQNFISRLVATRKIASLRKNNYKARLEWAFGLALQSTYGSPKMQARIPDLCLDIDEARRIRNLWMHNNGLFDYGYADAIQVGDRTPIFHPLFLRYQKDTKRKIPFILEWETFLSMYKSHLEFLHDLHDAIQRAYFGQKRSYSYKALKKGIEWSRLIIGK